MEDEFDIEVENEEIDISTEVSNDFLKGDKGDPGEKNTLTIGTVIKGNEASASITGESPNQILNLVLPKGDKGEDGGAYDDTEIRELIQDNADDIDTIQAEQITQNTNIQANTNARHTHSNKSVLDDISSTDVTNWNNKSNFSGDYNDLSNKPTIPNEVTETTVTNWGFTKNTGTYSKPSGGIPSTDMSSEVQTSLGKADTAIQQHQDISGKEDKINKVISLSSQSTDTEYPSAKCVYDIIGNVETILTTLTTGGGVS